MATFKELKDKLQGITPKKESPTEKPSDKDPVKKETIDKEMQKITKAKEMLDELSNWRT